MKAPFYLLVFIFIFNCKNESKQILKAEKEPITSDLEIDSIKEKPIKIKITKDFVLGKFDYKTDTTFVKVKSIHTTKPVLYLKNEVYEAFQNMHQAAKADGIDLIIVSGTRNFYEQKGIWERKWKKYSKLKPLERAKKILEYSSMPSTSRHHWGTDIDLNNLNNSFFETGKGKDIYNWLTQHAKDFGFYQTYTDKSYGRTGYNLERWHWSYLPLASHYLEFYKQHISYEDIDDFKGATLAKELDVIQNYVNGVDQSVKDYKAKK